MTPNVLLFTVLGILFATVLYIKFSDSRKEKAALKAKANASAETAEQTVQEDEAKDFDEDFFKATQAGEPYQQLLSLASQRDCAIIRSLLQADNVPTYCEGEHMNNIYGGIAGTMNAVVAIRLYILEKDYDTAFDIVKGFLEAKVQHPITVNQEVLGITVFPKAEK